MTHDWLLCDTKGHPKQDFSDLVRFDGFFGESTKSWFVPAWKWNIKAKARRDLFSMFLSKIPDSRTGNLEKKGTFPPKIELPPELCVREKRSFLSLVVAGRTLKVDRRGFVISVIAMFYPFAKMYNYCVAIAAACRVDSIDSVLLVHVRPAFIIIIIIMPNNHAPKHANSKTCFDGVAWPSAWRGPKPCQTCKGPLPWEDCGDS